MQRNVVVTIMDFAENYTCDIQDEVQAAHWCHKQATIYPVELAYYKCPKCLNLVTEYLVFISDDLKHDAHAVHHFMTKTYLYLQSQLNNEIYLGIQWSDGCTAQYKSKLPFSDVSYAYEDFSFPIERHFFGSRHGKGPCDGIGGVVKQKASISVKARTAIIRSAKEIFLFCKENMTIESYNCNDNHISRKFFFVCSNEIDRNRQARDVKTVKGTQQLHAIKTISKGIIGTRKLSCFCDFCLINEFDFCVNKDHMDLWKSVKLKSINTPTINKSIGLISKTIIHKEPPCPNDQLEKICLKTPQEKNQEVTPLDHVDVVASQLEPLQAEMENIELEESTKRKCLELNLKKDDFVKLLWGQSKAIWIAQIIEIDVANQQVHVSFMQQQGDYYYWPEVKDISWEPSSSVIEVISEPSFSERKSTNRIQYFVL